MVSGVFLLFLFFGETPEEETVETQHVDCDGSVETEITNSAVEKEEDMMLDVDRLRKQLEEAQCLFQKGMALVEKRKAMSARLAAVKETKKVKGDESVPVGQIGEGNVDKGEEETAQEDVVLVNKVDECDTESD